MGWTAGVVSHSTFDACFNCHDQGHGSDFEKILTEDNQPGLCFNCHDADGPASTDLESNFAGAFGHPVIAAGSSIQCLDCHNPHQAEPGTHVQGTNDVPGVLFGVTGSEPSPWPAAYGSESTFTSFDPAVKEYQVCFKCHSRYSHIYSDDCFMCHPATWDPDLGVIIIGYKFRSSAVQFNPNNASYHPVVQPLPANIQLAASQLTNGWQPGDVMACSDCHSNDAASPKGPHGSSTKWMLAGANKAWPYQDVNDNGSSTGTFFTLNSTTSNLFCMNCHPAPNSTASNNAHREGDHFDSESGGGALNCVSCHIRVPHGGKVSRLMNAAAPSSDLPARLWPDGNGGGNHYLQRFQKAASKDSYNDGNCGADFANNCDDHESDASGGENW